MEPGIQVTLKKNGVEYLESGIHGVESRTQNPEFPYRVRGGWVWGAENMRYMNTTALPFLDQIASWLADRDTQTIYPYETKHLFS